MRGALNGGGVHLLMIAVIMVMGYNLMGGALPDSPAATTLNQTQNRVIMSVNTSYSAKDASIAEDNLQLKTFGGVPIPTLGRPPTTCNPNDPVDVMLTLDYSGSMTGEKLQKAKAAAKRLVSIIETNPANRMGINSFSNQAKLYIPLTNEHTLLKAVIDNLPSGSGNTCLQCGIDMANREFANNTPLTISATAAATKKVDVLLTDGNANLPEPRGNAEQAALNSARQGGQSGVQYYPVGFGVQGGFTQGSTRVNERLLQQIATETKGKYYYSPSDDHLQFIFEDIGVIICN